MANHKGSEGVVHVGTSAIAELKGWETSRAMKREAEWQRESETRRIQEAIKHQQRQRPSKSPSIATPTGGKSTPSGAAGTPAAD